ncbi:riboflavin synthase [Paremcibacter congregatus]|uniref:Riboflavin synthase n=1 Tax=Paremcibacter congregatus TaxID=2043170 RepID=A0A2G4YN12_9PROT|nr:riboflavin synthase [Paremcibacter congregatus]PHZ83712.1 riboflavin synthase [Paremcibacter congregatus]QDE27414.1 riboflavin synthase [Paremcibacter congregatus]
MFTGIITDVGAVDSIEQQGDCRIILKTAFDTATIDIGASIACSGVCLTVVDKGEDWFAVDASAETLSCTNLQDWTAGTKVNLERALKIGEELGGHIVTGHVDGLGEITDITPEGDSLRMRFSVPASIARYIAEKGSVTINGISLTVNEVIDDKDGATQFGINVIPHTQEKTTFSVVKIGDKVNLEIDVLARYVARMNKFSNA